MRSRTAKQGPPKTIDEYLARVDEEKRAALEALRKTIRAIAPRAEECISYQLPGFRLDGRMLVWFGAAKHHCSLYPGGLVEDFRKDLEGYETSKGTIRFSPDRPLPAALVRKIVKAKMKDATARAARSAASRGRSGGADR